ncbi:MAG: 30S ribosomal protein S16 [Candidatus Cloacimonetes bacterium]|nr:30S ribosomal protein S16 [Candidatus Cloacimonadota bacterium]
MAVTIRLRRIGRKKQPSYRVVVTDSAKPRGGEYLDTLGFYSPRRQPAELRLDLEKVDAWVGKGAGMSDTVASLVRKARKGGDDKVALFPLSGEHERPQVEVHEPQAAPKKGRKQAAPAAEARVEPAAGETVEPQTTVAEAAETFDPGTPRGAAGEADAEA